MTDPTTYRIVRVYMDDRPPEVTRTGLTLEAARIHVQNPATHVEGEWFDGYTADPSDPEASFVVHLNPQPDHPHSDSCYKKD